MKRKRFAEIQYFSNFEPLHLDITAADSKDSSSRLRAITQEDFAANRKGISRTHVPKLRAQLPPPRFRDIRIQSSMEDYVLRMLVRNEPTMMNRCGLHGGSHPRPWHRRGPHLEPPRGLVFHGSRLEQILNSSRLPVDHRNSQGDDGCSLLRCVPVLARCRRVSRSPSRRFTQHFEQPFPWFGVSQILWHTSSTDNRDPRLEHLLRSFSGGRAVTADSD